VLRAGAWTARGLRVPARNALLADVVPANAYGRAYGFERSMDNLGAILGPLAAIGLIAAVGTRWAIALSVIPGLLAALAIVHAIRHTSRPTSQAKRKLRFHVRAVLVGDLRRVFAGIGAFELGNCAATLLILLATELLEPGRSHDSAITIALALYVA
jgi:MFS family permease